MQSGAKISLLFVVVTVSILRTDTVSFFDLNDLDWSIRPTDDLFTFVNGRWLNQTIIPPSQTEWGSVFTLSYETLNKLKVILEDLTKDETTHPVDSIQRQLSDLYLAGLDEQTIEETNIEPLKETLIQLENVHTYQDLIMFVVHWYKKMNRGLIFKFDVHADERNTSINLPTWRQTGITLPERDYYFRNDLRSKTVRMNYIHYIDRLLNLTNHLFNKTTNLIDAEDVLTLETQLAVAHHTPYELRNPNKNYNKLTVTELDRMMPNLDWPRMLKVLQISNDTMIISQLDYYQLLDKLIHSQPLNVWKNKIRFTILHKMSAYLNRDFVQARFYMIDHLIYGRQEDKPRWMKLVEDINKYIGESLGQLYTSRYFSRKAKQRTFNLVNHLIEVYRHRIQRNEWMSDVTKEKALIKLNKLQKKIGYPSEWQSFQDIRMNRWSYFDCMTSIFEFNYKKQIDDLKKAVDRNEWMIPPQTVNAFYNPLFNEIIYPAGILQEPFFLFDADDAINYGAVGSSIGHELTHGFDDQGRKYDENGNVRQWWTAEDIVEFNSRTKLIVEQYNHYKVFDNNVSGLLTLGENIADLGGLEIAYEAFLQTEQAKAGLLIDGLTPNQRFFLSYARVSRMKMTDERLVFLVHVDPHAPAMFRVNGPLSNMIGFYQTFDVTPNDKMYREPSKRVLIW